MTWTRHLAALGHCLPEIRKWSGLLYRRGRRCGGPADRGACMRTWGWRQATTLRDEQCHGKQARTARGRFQADAILVRSKARRVGKHLGHAALADVVAVEVGAPARAVDLVTVSAPLRAKDWQVAKVHALDLGGFRAVNVEQAQRLI